MAVVGLIILILYSFVALAAPMITPYNPERDIVAGQYAPPSWYRYFPGGRGLSENTVLDARPGFYTDPSNDKAWQLTGDTAHISETFDPKVSSQTGSGSERIILNRSSGPLTGNYTATFEKVFDWPYEGPPGGFTGTLSILTPTATAQEPVYVTLHIRRLGSDARAWDLTSNANVGAGAPNPSWSNFPFVSNQGWQKPSSIDSNDVTLQSLVGVSNLDASGVIFSSKNQYAYGVTVTFTSASASTAPLTVYLDDVNLKLVGTSWGLLGTDTYGYDIWSQLLYGTRVSLEVGLLSAFIGITVGLGVGLMAGYLGKIVDEVLMRFTDMLLVIPGLPLLIVLVAVLGNQIGSSRLVVLILVIGFLGWMGFARVVRAQVLSLKERPFVEAAKAAGAGPGHIVGRHVVPNIVGLIYVNLALAVPGAILAEAALSFLGLGDLTVASWGRMLNQVEENSAQAVWWWVVPPGLSIALVSLAFVLIGFSLDTLFNPRLRQRR